MQILCRLSKIVCCEIISVFEAIYRMGPYDLNPVTPVRESARHIPYFCSNPIYEQTGRLRFVSFASRVRVVSSASCCRIFQLTRLISERRRNAENARVENLGVKISGQKTAEMNNDRGRVMKSRK